MMERIAGGTIDDLYGPAMTITEQTVADEYFKALVDWQVSAGMDRAEAEKIQRLNLGYYAGYYDHETRLRVERLFRCEHPIFGKAADHIPTAEEAFRAGYDLAKRRMLNG